MGPMRPPVLKYDRLVGSVPGLVARCHAVTSLCLSDKILALGTAAGSVHVLDYEGHEVKWAGTNLLYIRPACSAKLSNCLQVLTLCHTHHKGAVNELSFDSEGEFLASCSEDGTVVVASLASDDAIVRHDFRMPVKVSKPIQSYFCLWPTSAAFVPNSI